MITVDALAAIDDTTILFTVVAGTPVHQDLVFTP